MNTPQNLPPKKYSRKKWVILILILLLVFAGLFFLKRGFFKSAEKIEPGQNGALVESGSGSGPESYGEVLEDDVPDNLKSSHTDNRADPNVIKKLNAQILKDLIACLDFTAVDVEGVEVLTIDKVLNLIKANLGSFNLVDRFEAWSLKTKSGGERRVRLEMTESDTGDLAQELHFFGVDQQGQTYPIELDPEDTKNPNAEKIADLLKQGQVYFHEKANSALFPTGERLEYLERNGKLAEIELLKSDRIFKCTDVSKLSSCQCVQ